MLYWFTLALFGFCSLRLFEVLGGWRYYIESAVGHWFSAKKLYNILLLLALFGIVFFYNLTDVVMLRAISPELHILAGVWVCIGLWLLVCAYHPSNIPSILGNTAALGMAVIAFANTLVSGDLTSVVCFSALTLCFCIEWCVCKPKVAASYGWLNELVCVVMALGGYWLLFMWLDVTTWTKLI